MDESTRVGLNFFITFALLLGALALLSVLMLPSSYHGNPLYVVGGTLGTLVAAHRLNYGGTLTELELEPLPPADGYPDDESGFEFETDLTPAQRYERRQNEDGE